MRVSYHWLKTIDPTLTLAPSEVARRLTAAGHEVEGTIDEARALDHVVVVELRAVAPHPHADKLRLVTVFDGAAEQVLVSGAPNLEVGQRVPLARLGASLPGGLTIARREIRGVESEGMLCSEAELGLSKDTSGVMQLAADAPLGAPLAEVLGRTDVLFELAAPANRPDLLSHVGVARELSALVRFDRLRALAAGDVKPPKRSKAPRRKKTSPPRIPRGVLEPRFVDARDARASAAEVRVAEGGAAAKTLAEVATEAPERCPHYTARIIEGVRVGPSPAWVRRRLEALGVRPISNVVDATNLVLLELGQPLHAFDLDRLAGGRVVARLARPGERLTTLDGVDRALDGDDLVIADAERPIALAGVMGGQTSEVGEGTTRVLLESAYFQRQGVRRTGKRHGLHTEASHRFERGVDPAQVEVALDRVAALVVAWAGGKIRRGVLSAGRRPKVEHRVALRVERASMVLGWPVSAVEAKLVLGLLGLELTKAKGLVAQTPSWRVDLEREIDLVEELGRVAGLDDVPTVLPPAPRTAAIPDVAPRTDDVVRDALVGVGFLETIALAFSSAAELDALGIPRGDAVQLANPLGEESALMRVSMLPALLRAARHNASVGRDDLRLFELGRTFRWGALTPVDAPSLPVDARGALPIESRRLGLLLRGASAPAHWAGRPAPASVFDLKGVVEGLLDRLGVAGLEVRPAERPFLHPRASGAVWIGDAELGVIGELHPDVAKRLGLDGAPTFVAELALDVLDARRAGHARMAPLPRFPRVTRDMSFFVPTSIPAGAILGALRALDIPALEQVALFDVYEGQGVPDGQRSLALTLRFGVAERTLTDAEVDGWVKQAFALVVERFGATLRVG